MSRNMCMKKRCLKGIAWLLVFMFGLHGCQAVGSDEADGGGSVGAVAVSYTHLNEEDPQQHTDPKRNQHDTAGKDPVHLKSSQRVQKAFQRINDAVVVSQDHQDQ